MSEAKKRKKSFARRVAGAAAGSLMSMFNYCVTFPVTVSNFAYFTAYSNAVTPLKTMFNDRAWDPAIMGFVPKTVRDNATFIAPDANPEAVKLYLKMRDRWSALSHLSYTAFASRGSDEGEDEGCIVSLYGSGERESDRAWQTPEVLKHVSRQEMDEYALLHEARHCTDENKALAQPQNEADADLYAIKSMEAANPASQIRKFVLAYRAMDGGDSHGALMLDAMMHGRTLPTMAGIKVSLAASDKASASGQSRLRDFLMERAGAMEDAGQSDPALSQFITVRRYGGGARSYSFGDGKLIEMGGASLALRQFDGDSKNADALRLMQLRIDAYRFLQPELLQKAERLVAYYGISNIRADQAPVPQPQSVRP
ncbi:MAG: hypothetical protein H6866_02635 [Rhodospirillales bacterium]|nr:MAG: hypothetical protein H6866_02635 [Rhodospirillales bacterium]